MIFPAFILDSVSQAETATSHRKECIFFNWLLALTGGNWTQRYSNPSIHYHHLIRDLGWTEAYPKYDGVEARCILNRSPVHHRPNT